jgi:hypothetical protein
MKEFRSRFYNINPRHAKLGEDLGKDNVFKRNRRNSLSFGTQYIHDEQ